MMTKDGLIFEANSLKQGRLQALTRQQLQAQATQNRERRWEAPKQTLFYAGRVTFVAFSRWEQTEAASGPVEAMRGRVDKYLDVRRLATRYRPSQL